jgi:hypothetical protein
VSAAAAVPRPSEVPAAASRSPSGNSVEDPTTSQCTRLYVGMPTASATTPASARVVGNRDAPNRCRSTGRAAPWLTRA